MHNSYYTLLQKLAFLSGFAGLCLIGVSLTSVGCTYSTNSSESSSETPVQAVVSTTEQDVLDKSIEAHGGLDTWRSFGSLSYTLQKRERTEEHVIDLHTRKTLLSTETYQIGYDGTDVWITPGLDAYSGTPRFINGLDFYFFSIPFVLADPGTQREYLGRVQINDQEYEAMKVSYDSGVGASPDDYYIVHLDPDTYQLRLLLYTATFYSQEPSENYNARMYEDWKEIDGLVLPTKLVAYQWDGEQQQLGEMRGETVFSEIKLGAESPPSSMFEAPEGAEIDVPEKE